MKRFLILWVAALMLTGVGCGGVGNPDDAEKDSLDNAIKADGITRPLGTYRAETNRGLKAGDTVTLVLMSDMTFYRETMIQCIQAPCKPIGENGTYKYTLGGKTRYLRLYNTSGASLARFEYESQQQDSILKLRNVMGSGGWITLAKDGTSPWCELPEQCDLQGLMTPRCLGNWVCAKNACSYECGGVTDQTIEEQLQGVAEILNLPTPKVWDTPGATALDMLKNFVEQTYNADEAALFEYLENQNDMKVDEGAVVGTLQASVALDSLHHAVEYLNVDADITAEEIANLKDLMTTQHQLLVANDAVFGFNGYVQNSCAAPEPYLMVLDLVNQKIFGMELEPCFE